MQHSFHQIRIIKSMAGVSVAPGAAALTSGNEYLNCFFLRDMTFFLIFLKKIQNVLYLNVCSTYFAMFKRFFATRA